MSAGGRIPLLELIPEHGRVGRGWSGAPVLSTQGVVIGVFVQLRDGVAHAVPIEFVLRMEEGEDVPFAYLPGVATQPLTSRYTRKAARIGGNTSGVRVAKVKRDTALQVGDVIVEVNGKPVSNSGTIAWGFAQASWQAAVSTETPGKNIPVRVLREGELQTVKVVVRDSRLATGATAWADNRAVMAGKMIFATLSFELLRRWGDEWPRDAPEDLVRVGMEDMGEAKDVVVLMGEVKGLKQVYGREDRKCGECEEREDVQVHENWEELHFLRVTRVDEKPVRQLEDLAQESKRGEDIVIEFENGFVAQVPNGELVESTMQDGKDEFEVVRTDGKI